MKGKRTSALASRIKRVMQADEDVGKIAHDTPILIGHALEVFLQQLCKGASDIAVERGDKMLTPSHLKDFVNKETSMDFLRGMVESAPDLPDKSAASPANKRQRTSGGRSGEGGRGRGRGRGRGKGRAAGASAESAEDHHPGEQKEEANDEAGPSTGVKAEVLAVKKEEGETPMSGPPPDAVGSAEAKEEAAGHADSDAQQGGDLPAGAVNPGQPELSTSAAQQALPPSLVGIGGGASVEDEDDYDAE